MSVESNLNAELNVNAGRNLNAEFHWPIRIYWEDTDAGGVVYYANYLKFLERARSEWLRAAGFEQDQLRDETGVAFVVRRIEVDYLAPARFNDALNVSVKIQELGGASLSLTQLITRGDTRLVVAQVTLACVDATRFKPVKIPAPLLQALAQAT